MTKRERELTVATCQFPVSADIIKNESYVIKQLKEAKAQGAEIAHFSECCLSGYAGTDFKAFNRQDIPLIQSALNRITRYSKENKIWIIVGSHHFEKNQKKPYNCLWVINDRGDVIDRYNKRFLTGKPGELDRHYYLPGNRTVHFKIKGISCGLLICHEWRFPELYREYKRLGAEIIFQSWYDGRQSAADFKEKGKELGSLILGTVRGSAANNYLWISASNTSQKESNFASFMVRPDGKLVGQLKRNTTGVLISRIHFDTEFADPSRPMRDKISHRI